MIYSSFDMSKLSKCWKYILWNITASNNYRRMKQLPLELTHWDKMNGSGFILLWSLDTKIFDKTSMNQHLTFVVLHHLTFCWLSLVIEGWTHHHLTHLVLSNISASSDCKRMKQLPLESSHWDEWIYPSTIVGCWDIW